LSTPLPDDLDPERLQAVVDLWRAAGKRTEIPVAGGSMFPVLRPGWVLLLDHAQAQHPFGSVIVFLQGRLLVAHRVVGRRGERGCVRSTSRSAWIQQRPFGRAAAGLSDTAALRPK
jgi:hypothetical protein